MIHLSGNALLGFVLSLAFIIVNPVDAFDQTKDSPYISWDRYDKIGDLIDLSAYQVHSGQHSGDTALKIIYSPLTSSYSRYRVGAKVSWNLQNKSAYQEYSECIKERDWRYRYIIYSEENNTIISIHNRSYLIPFENEIICINVDKNNGNITANPCDRCKIVELSEECKNCTDSNIIGFYDEWLGADKEILVYTKFDDLACREYSNSMDIFTESLNELTFWARGDAGGEISTFSVETCPNSTRTTGPIALSRNWHEYSLDLVGLNLSCSPKFAWSTNVNQNPDGCTIYIDDLSYE